MYDDLISSMYQAMGRALYVGESLVLHTGAEAPHTGCIIASQTPPVWLVQHTLLLLSALTLLTAFESSRDPRQPVRQLITRWTAPDCKICLDLIFLRRVWCEFGPRWVVDNLVTR